ncbi:MipA/OmpV family protein [Microbulbifer guangxiensis]|uniref:MipA/OmpV family protein n=1 Tax=Microbulbifer guangxiensis TaxID=2904249 RepID=UPI001F2D1DE6|nr:MipA/OmpV family protein [Microbulbifer guangxiensis]
MPSHLNMYTRILITSLLLLAHGTALGAEIRTPQWELSLASGRGVIENPLEGRADGETFLLPSLSYYGKRFFFSNLTAGYSLVENKRFYIDLIAQPNEDGLFFQLDKPAVAAGSVSIFMPLAQAPEVSEIDRRVSLMAGASSTLVSGMADLSFSWLHDVTGVHHGSEVHLSIDKQYGFLGGALGWGIGAVHKDTDLVDYYYHFREEEAGAFAERYALAHPPGDVTDQYARLHFSYPLGKGFALRLAGRYNHFDLDGRLPRFIRKSETLSWFAGIQYSIGSGR